MGSIRYAVAGKGIEQSLSPLLFQLVAHHLNLSETINTDIVEAEAIEDALAWGYAGTTPMPRDYFYTDAPLNKFRTKTLVQKCFEALDEPLDLPPESLRITEVEPAPFTINSTVPQSFDHEEIWMNLTTPLKHQLHSVAVNYIDNSMDTRSVNTLRWDGNTWWCLSTDGIGMMRVLIHRGISPHDCVGLIGGGSAARSFASTWVEAGGSIHWVAGKRELDERFLSQRGEDPACYVIFEDHDVKLDQKPQFHARYEPDADLDMLLTQDQTSFDGRWMLVAQHLESWKHLWCPQRSGDLPSIEVLLAKLIQAELTLRSYKRS